MLKRAPHMCECAVSPITTFVFHLMVSAECFVSAAAATMTALMLCIERAARTHTHH